MVKNLTTLVQPLNEKTRERIFCAAIRVPVTPSFIKKIAKFDIVRFFSVTSFDREGITLRRKISVLIFFISL